MMTLKMLAWYVMLLASVTAIAPQVQSRLFLEDLASVLTVAPPISVPQSWWHHQYRSPAPCDVVTKSAEFIQQLDAMDKPIEIIDSTLNLLHVRLHDDPSTNKSQHDLITSTTQTINSCLGILAGIINQHQNNKRNLNWLINDNVTLGGYLPPGTCIDPPMTWAQAILGGKGRRRRHMPNPPLEWSNAHIQHIHNQPSTFHLYYSMTHPPTMPPTSIPQQDRPTYQYPTRDRVSFAPDIVPEPQNQGANPLDAPSIESSANLQEKLQQISRASLPKAKDLESTLMADDGNVQENKIDKYPSTTSKLLKWKYPFGNIKACIPNRDSIEECYLLEADMQCISDFIKEHEQDITRSSATKYRAHARRVSRELRHTRDKHQETKHRKQHENLSHKISKDTHFAGVEFLPQFEGGYFGAALFSDQQKVAKAVDDLNVNQRKLAMIMTENRESIMTIAATVDDNFARTTTIIDDLMTKMEAYTTTVSETLNKIDNSLKDVSKQTQFLTTIQSVMAVMMQILSIQNEQASMISDFQDRYLDIMKAINHQRLPEKIFSASQVGNDLEKLRHALRGDLDVPTRDSLRPFFQDGSAQISLDGKMIVYDYKIPIVRRDSHIVTYQLTSVPVLRNNTWLRLVQHDDYFIVDKQNKHWIKLSPRNYLACLADTFHTCPTTYPVWKNGPDMCLMTPVLFNKQDTGMCEFEVVHVPPTTEAIIENTGPCSWIISPGAQPLDLKQSCDSSVVTDNVMRSASVQAVVHLSLTVGCSVSIGSAYLHCPAVIQETKSLINLGFDTIGSQQRPSSWGDVSEINAAATRYLTMSSSPHGATFPGLKFDRSLTRAGFVNATALLNKNHISKLSYDEDIMELSSLIEDRSMESKKSFWRDWGIGWPSLTTWLTWYATLMSTLVFGIMAMSAYRASRGAGIAAAVGIPLSQSKSWAITLTPVMTNTTVNLTKVVLSNMDPPKEETSPDTTATLVACGGQGWGHILYPAVVMIAIHCLIMWTLSERNKMFMKGVAMRLGYLPLNKTSVHHAGEPALVANVVFKLSNIMNTYEITRTAVIQLCTLPRSAEEWQCKVEPSMIPIVTGAGNNRLSSTWTFKITWGPLCIVSDLDPTIETCQELPSTIQVDKAEILCQLKGLDFCTWWRSQAIALLQLSIRAPNYYKEIYNKMKPTQTPEAQPPSYLSAYRDRPMAPPILY